MFEDENITTPFKAADSQISANGNIVIVTEHAT